ncbi:MAG: hypothetical protein AAF416_14480 [Pseudomonadota bacterium]
MQRDNGPLGVTIDACPVCAEAARIEWEIWLASVYRRRSMPVQQVEGQQLSLRLVGQDDETVGKRQARRA